MYNGNWKLRRWGEVLEVTWHTRYEDIDSIVNGCTRDQNIIRYRLVKVEIVRRHGEYCDLKMQFVYINEYHMQKLAVLRTEDFNKDEVYEEIVKTIRSFEDQDYILQFQYDKDFRKRKFVVLCFEK